MSRDFHIDELVIRVPAGHCDDASALAEAVAASLGERLAARQTSLDVAELHVRVPLDRPAAALHTAVADAALAAIDRREGG